MSIVLALALAACSKSNEETVTKIETSDTAVVIDGDTYADNTITVTIDTTREADGTSGNYLISNYEISLTSEKKICTPKVMSNVTNHGDVYIKLHYSDEDIQDNIVVGAIILAPGETVTFPTISGRNVYAIACQAVSVTGDYTFAVDW